MFDLCIKRVPLRTEYLLVKNTDRGAPGRGISRKEGSCGSSTTLVSKIRLLLTQPSGQALSDLRQQEKFFCFLGLCRRLAKWHQPSTLGVWYSSTRKMSTRSSTRHKGLIRSLSELSRSIYPRVKFLLNRIAGTNPISTNQRMRSTLCRIVTSLQHLSIGRLSTPSDQRFAHPKVPMKNRKTCTSLR